MNIRDQKTEKTKSEFVTGLFGIVVIITIGFLLPSLALAQETGNSSFTEEECTAISRTTGQNLIYYPPGCNIVDTDNVNIEYIDKIEDVSILRSGLDRERNTLLRFSDPAKAKTHMDEVVALLLETHYVSTTDDKYKALPYNKETVMIGDGGAILLNEKLSVLGRVPVKELEETLQNLDGVYAIVMDGSVEAKLARTADDRDVKYIIAPNATARPRRTKLIAPNTL